MDVKFENPFEFQLDILDSVLTTFDNVGSAYKVINVDMSSLND